MDWAFVVSLVLAIPIILFPAAFVWYLQLGAMCMAIGEARQTRIERRTL